METSTDIGVSRGNYMDKYKFTMTKNKKIRPKKTIWAVLFIAIGLLALVFVMNSSYFVIDDVLISGNESVTDDNIKEKVFNKEINYWLLNKQELMNVILENHWIKEVQTIKKRFPNELYLEIEEREPQAVWICEGINYIISEDLVILEKQSNYPRNLPYLTGVELLKQEINIGKSIDQELSPYTEKLFNYLSKYGVENKSEINLDNGEIRFYLSDRRLVKLGEPQEIKEKVRALDNVQNDLQQRDSSYHLDLRVPKYPILRSNAN